MSISAGKARLPQAESRAAAIAAARALLREDGAAAVTLKAVGARIGRTHANLLHHFGSAAGLHRALAEDIAASVARSIRQAIGRRRRGEADVRHVVDAMFDAFRSEQVGELIGWIALTRQREALAPITDTVAAILADFREAGDVRAMDQVILGLVLLAIGDSLAGPEIAAATGDDPAAVRDIAVAQVRALVGEA